MDHMKEALLSKIKSHKAKMGGHEEHLEAGPSHGADEDHQANEIGDKAPGLSADQNDHVEEEAGEMNAEHGQHAMGYDEKAKLLETLIGNSGHRNPHSLHSMAHEHMKKDLHEMKGKKSY